MTYVEPLSHSVEQLFSSTLMMPIEFPMRKYVHNFNSCCSSVPEGVSLFSHLCECVSLSLSPAPLEHFYEACALQGPLLKA